MRKKQVEDGRKPTVEQIAFLDLWRLPYSDTTTRGQVDSIILAAKSRAGLLGDVPKKQASKKYKIGLTLTESHNKNRGNKGLIK